MTVAPQRPYSHAYDPNKDPMELVSTAAGEMQRWRADALLLGETGAAVAARDDAIAKVTDIEAREQAVAAREARADARERAIEVEAAGVSHVAGRAAALWDRLEQIKADQEREPEKLAAPPGEPASADAALPGDPSRPAPLQDDAPAPSGELHSLPPKTGEERGVEPDARGEFLRLKSDETEFPDPELARPPAEQQQLIAAGLDGE